MKRLHAPSISKLNRYALWIQQFFWVGMAITVNLLAIDIILGIIVDGVFLKLALLVLVFLVFLVLFNLMVLRELRNPS